MSDILPPHLKPQHPYWGVRPWTRHSLVLMVAGLVYVAIGLSYVYSKPSGARYEALIVALQFWNFDWWGAVFVGAGLLAMLSARWPPVAETWGYMVLTGLSTAWAGFYAAGVIIGGAPFGNLSGALSWGLIAFIWWAISGLDNPSKVVVYDHGTR